MNVLDVLWAQLLDPFRIGLLVALVLTASNTAAAIGTLIPTLLGLIFVAALIPLSLGAGDTDRLTTIGVGLISNAIILAAIFTAKSLYRRLSQR